MIPNAFMFLAEYPLTPNKKIDRKALPIPDQTRPDLVHQYVAPRDELEEGIAIIFANLLKLERVGIHDNFFDLGGHSLLATQVVSRIQQNFNVALPLRNLFEAPSVAELALIILEKKLEQLESHRALELLAGIEKLDE
jgi:acyl carrier protein